jgi:hypothetical protein
VGSLDDAGFPQDDDLNLGHGTAGRQGGAEGLQRLLDGFGTLSEEETGEVVAAEAKAAAPACKPACEARRGTSHDTARLSDMTAAAYAGPPPSALDLAPCSPHLSGGGPLPLPLAQAPAQAPAQVLGPRAVGGRRLRGTAGRGGPAIALAAAAAAAVALAVPMGPTAAAPFLLALAALLACAAGVLAAAAGRNGGRQAPTRPRDASSADPRRAAAHAPPLSKKWEGSGEQAGCSA